MHNTIYILNGPNLNLLGLREPEIYGAQTLSDIEDLCMRSARDLGFNVFFKQSNAEHQLIDWIHQARERACAIIINPAAYSHTSIAILDALKSFTNPVVEVHLSNIHQRESFRHYSYVSSRAECVIAGCGAWGYCFAIEWIAKQLG